MLVSQARRVPHVLRLRPGEGAVESHAAAWGDETDKRRALSSNENLCKWAVFQLVRKHLLAAWCLPDSFQCNRILVRNMFIKHIDGIQQVLIGLRAHASPA